MDTTEDDKRTKSAWASEPTIPHFDAPLTFIYFFLFNLTRTQKSRNHLNGPDSYPRADSHTCDYTPGPTPHFYSIPFIRVREENTRRVVIGSQPR